MNANLSKSFHFVLKDYLGEDTYKTLVNNYPDLSELISKSKEPKAVNLLVGGNLIPEKFQFKDSTWETLDPYMPVEVTYKTVLQDTVWANNNKHRFDVILIPAVLEHIDPYYLRDCVDNINLVIKYEGMLFITVPYMWTYHPGDERYNFGGDFVRFTPQGIQDLFINRGIWNIVACNLVIPAECPDGIGICCIFKKGY